MIGAAVRKLLFVTVVVVRSGDKAFHPEPIEAASEVEEPVDPAIHAKVRQKQEDRAHGLRGGPVRLAPSRAQSLNRGRGETIRAAGGDGPLELGGGELGEVPEGAFELRVRVVEVVHLVRSGERELESEDSERQSRVSA